MWMRNAVYIVRESTCVEERGGGGRRTYVHASICKCACVRACVRACVHVCMRVGVGVSVSVWCVYVCICV